jgi:hypothetical protein
MTDHRDEKHNDLGFEREDLGGRQVYGFMISLAIAGVLIYYMIWGMFYLLDAYEKKHQPTGSPMVKYQTDLRGVTPEDVNKFPEPRLETDERNEINDFRYREEETLHSYGWVDQSAEVVRIPIDRAIQIVAQQGLPTIPKAGTNPPSIVNTGNQAAAKADTRNSPKPAVKKQKQNKGKSQ